MFKVYNFLFYCIYKFASFLGNTVFRSEALALVGISAILWYNFLTAIILYEIYSKRVIDAAILLSLIFVANIILNYLYFFRKDRARKIVAQFDSEPKSILRLVLTIIYIIASVFGYYYYAGVRRDMFS